jgi:ABC-type iron transport system FetAB permease component
MMGRGWVGVGRDQPLPIPNSIPMNMVKDTHADAARPAERLFTATLLFAGLRCLVQYILLPFVLPLLGIVSGQRFGIMVALDLVALAAIIFSVRRFWQVRHPRRWEYLLLACVAIIVMIVFLVFDLGVRG